MQRSFSSFVVLIALLMIFTACVACPAMASPPNQGIVKQSLNSHPMELSSTQVAVPELTASALPPPRPYPGCDPVSHWLGLCATAPKPSPVGVKTVAAAEDSQQNTLNLIFTSADADVLTRLSHRNMTKRDLVERGRQPTAYPLKN